MQGIVEKNLYSFMALLKFSVDFVRFREVMHAKPSLQQYFLRSFLRRSHVKAKKVLITAFS